MFTLNGMVGFEGFVTDPSRIAAQVVTGLGFIGAGSIIRDGSGVTGLTTAATVWASGALGMAFAAGAYVPAGSSFVLCIAVLTAYRPLQDIASRRGKSPVVVSVEYQVGHGVLGLILTGLEELEIRFESIKIEEPMDDPDRARFSPTDAPVTPGAPVAPAPDDEVRTTDDNRRTISIRMVLTQHELSKLHDFGARLEEMGDIRSVTFS